MKNNRFAGVALLAMITVLSCKEEEPQPYFEVTGLQDSYVFAPDVVCSEEFHINSSDSWDITANDLDWLNITPVRSLGGHSTVTLSVKENLSNDSKTGSFTIKGNSFSQTVNVTQEGCEPSVRMSADYCVFGFGSIIEEGSDVLDIVPNGSWTASVSDSWIHISDKSGSAGECRINLEVDATEDEHDRNGYVRFTVGGKTFDYLVFQHGKPAAYLFVDKTELMLNCSGGSDVDGGNVVSIQTDGGWTIICDPWVSVSQSSGAGDAQLVVTASENAGAVTRYGTITINTPSHTASVVVAQSPDTEGNFINITAPLVWKVTASGPDWKSSAKFYPDGYEDQAYAEWVVTPANSNAIAYSFQSSYPGFQAKGGVWTGDGLYLHVPVLSVNAGQTLTFYSSLRVSGTGGQYWAAEISLDDGATWTMMDSGNTYTTNVLKAPANIQLSAKGTIISFSASYKFPSNMTAFNMQIRLICPDGGDQFNGAVDAPSTSCTANICRYTAGEVEYDGPTIVIE